MIPPENQHIIKLPTTPKVVLDSLNVREIVQQWISALQSHFSSSSTSQLSELFHDDSWWRDMLALSWEFHTIKGLQHIQEFLAQNQATYGELSNFRLPAEDNPQQPQPTAETPAEGLTWVTLKFSFDTHVGHGSGVVYLTQAEENGKWKAYSVYTSLQKLNGFEEPLGLRRLDGTIESMPGGNSRGNWLERRQKQVEFVEEDPIVLVIGAGKPAISTRHS